MSAKMEGSFYRHNDEHKTSYSNKKSSREVQSEGSTEGGDFNNRGWERREGGEWDFRSGSDWVQQNYLYTGKLSTSDKSCLCNEMTMSKILIIIFTLLNLTMIASGGVVFTLGLTGYWRNHNNFSQLMVGSSCLMCWGTLATTFDILALLGIFQKKKKLILPWLLWYILEVLAVVGMVMLATVYTDTFYCLPLLVKPILTVYAWFNVRHVYKHSLRTFYSRNIDMSFY